MYKANCLPCKWADVEVGHYEYLAASFVTYCIDEINFVKATSNKADCMLEVGEGDNKMKSVDAKMLPRNVILLEKLLVDFLLPVLEWRFAMKACAIA